MMTLGSSLLPEYQSGACNSFWYLDMILLNSAVQGKVDGWVEQDQLDQLDQLLLEFKHQHVIVACHHHPFAMKSHWIDQHRLKMLKI